MHLMENLPRNLEDIARVPNGGEPRVATFSLDELKTLWDAALRRTRCWMALALNCGMGQKDITDLKVGEIDWAGGYIERTRSKTGVKTKHKLWGKTLDLLAEFRTVGAAPDDRFFLNENGLPLLRRWVEDGVFRHCDAIKNAIDRLLLKTGLNGGRGFYCLRKTGASLIETIDPAVTEMYLAHAEQGMKKHYAQRDWARLERALLEMEGRLGGVLRE
jgi:integrase